MTRSEQSLLDIIDWLAHMAEDAMCTCASDVDERNRLHCAAGRRRRDSRCVGVSTAVEAELRKRRALAIGRRERRQERERKQ